MYEFQQSAKSLEEQKMTSFPVQVSMVVDGEKSPFVRYFIQKTLYPLCFFYMLRDPSPRQWIYTLKLFHERIFKYF